MMQASPRGMIMRKHMVLVMENEKTDSGQIKTLLDDQYIVMQAFNEQEALHIVSHGKENICAALISCCLLITRKNKIMDSVKKALLSYDIPIIALLDHYGQDTAASSIKAGAEEILIKPYEKSLLQRRVHNMVIRNELRLAGQYDSLTGVYNKETFYEKTEALVRRNPERNYTIICLDIDRFKIVNDLYGTEEGDRLLQFVANHLKVGTAEAGGAVGRIVADVFACCYPNIGGQYAYIAELITKLFKDYPLQMELVAAIGFYQVEDRFMPASRMCDRALLALKSVKNKYVKNYAVYDQKLRANLILEQEIVYDMESALENREFKVYMQPKCDMDTGKIVGAEALVRWQHPEKGLIPPSEFIPAFEKNQFIIKVDYFIWEEVCRELRRQIAAGKRPIPISVNVSRTNLYQNDL